MIALPVFALSLNLGGHAVPLSKRTEEAKLAGRGVMLIGVMALSGLLSALAA